MGRPIKGTVDYFPHYIVGGKTLFILESDYGNDGYAFWFKLLEILGGVEGMYFNYNSPADLRFLLSKTRVDQEKCLQILDTLALVEAIDKQLWIEHKIVWVQNLVDNVKDAFKKRLNNIPKKPIFSASENGLSSIIVVSVGGNPVLSEFPVEETIQNVHLAEFLPEETGKGKERERKVKEMKLNKRLYITKVFEFWQSSNITKHRSMTPQTERQINLKLDEYTDDELIECITNYSAIYNDANYMFDTAWSLHDFLEKSHFEKFLNERDPYKFYPRVKRNAQSSQNEQLMREIEADMQSEQIRSQKALPDH